jgi:hypothetical protein
VELHRGINFSRLEIPADAGGLIFTAGSVVALLIAIPPFRWFLLGAIVAGAVAACVIFRWRRAHLSALLPTEEILPRSPLDLRAGTRRRSG